MFLLPVAACLARKLYESLRREAAAIHIQKNACSYAVRKYYTKLRANAIVIQTGLRAMAANVEYRQRRRNKAAIIIQVCSLLLQRVAVDICWKSKIKFALTYRPNGAYVKLIHLTNKLRRRP